MEVHTPIGRFLLRLRDALKTYLIQRRSLPYLEDRTRQEVVAWHVTDMLKK